MDSRLVNYNGTVYCLVKRAGRWVYKGKYVDGEGVRGFTHDDLDARPPLETAIQLPDHNPHA